MLLVMTFLYYVARLELEVTTLTLTLTYTVYFAEMCRGRFFPAILVNRALKDESPIGV